MNILILEDSNERQQLFKNLLKSHNIFITDKISEAIKACEDIQWNIMFLDHDLDQQGWVSSKEENTGYSFVKWLVSTNFQKKSLNYVHSMNPIGANHMVNLLHDYGRDAIWMPFNLLLEKGF